MSGPAADIRERLRLVEAHEARIADHFVAYCYRRTQAALGKLSPAQPQFG